MAWPCSAEVAQAESGGHRIRVSAGVSNAVAQKKVLPDVADLKDKKLAVTVVIAVVVDTKGDVRCTNPEQGDADLFQRSVEAARQWQFRPYTLNGERLVVETQIEFSYKRKKVDAQ